MASLRRLMLVLLAILARPWIWLVLAVWVLWPVLALVSHLMSPSATLTPVTVVPGPAVPPNSGADARDDFAHGGREALARLSRLKHLELRGTGLEAGILLPPLPALEACGVG